MCIGVIYHDVTDHDPAQCTWLNALRSPHTAAKTQEKGRVNNIPHRDIAYSYVFQQTAIDCFKRKTTAVIKHTIGDGDVLKSAIRFCSKFNTTCWSFLVRHLVELLT